MKIHLLIFILWPFSLLSTFPSELPDLNIALDPIDKQFDNDVDGRQQPKSYVVNGKRYFTDQQRKEWREAKRLKRIQMTVKERKEFNRKEYEGRMKKLENMSPKSKEKEKVRKKEIYHRYYLNKTKKKKLLKNKSKDGDGLDDKKAKGK